MGPIQKINRGFANAKVNFAKAFGTGSNIVTSEMYKLGKAHEIYKASVERVPIGAVKDRLSPESQAVLNGELDDRIIPYLEGELKSIADGAFRPQPYYIVERAAIHKKSEEIANLQDELQLQRDLVNTHRHNRACLDRTIKNLTTELDMATGKIPRPKVWYGSMRE